MLAEPSAFYTATSEGALCLTMHVVVVAVVVIVIVVVYTYYMLCSQCASPIVP